MEARAASERAAQAGAGAGPLEGLAQAAFFLDEPNLAVDAHERAYAAYRVAALHEARRVARRDRAPRCLRTRGAHRTRRGAPRARPAAATGATPARRARSRSHAPGALSLSLSSVSLMRAANAALTMAASFGPGA
jgi:hypothetical protein